VLNTRIRPYLQSGLFFNIVSTPFQTLFPRMLELCLMLSAEDFVFIIFFMMYSLLWNWWFFKDYLSTPEA
jgi:hypothetical protein